MTGIKDLVEKFEEKLDGYYVSVYNIESCYGGPEEGGWWYDWYIYVGAVYYETEEEARKQSSATYEKLKKENAGREGERRQAIANMPEGDSPYLDTEGYIPKGWGDGGKLCVVVEQYPPGKRVEDQEVPHYC
jgi:hypothetical protein